MLSIYSDDLNTGLDYSLDPIQPPMQYVVDIFMITEAGTVMNFSSYYMSFEVTMTDPCFSTTIEIYEPAILPSQDYTYYIGETGDVQYFDVAYPNVDYQLALTCPSYEYSLIYQDGTDIDATLFFYNRPNH